MSFFNDFLESFNVDELHGKITIVAVLGKGIAITGKFQLIEISEELIEVKNDREKLVVCGENLTAKSISKGEIVVTGKLSKVETEEL